MPAKKIFFLLGEVSAYNSSFRLAGQLQEQGYEVCYLVFGKEGQHIRNNGFRSVLLDPLQKKDRKIRSMKEYARFYYVYQYIVNRKIEKLILRERPALCLINILNLPLSVKFLQHRIPLVNYVSGFTSRFSWRIPSVLSGVVPSAKWYSGVQNFFSWVMARATYLRQKGRFALYSRWMLSAKECRRLDFLSQIKQYGGKVYLSEYNPTLETHEYFAFPEAMDLPGRKHASNYVYAGAQLFDRNDGLTVLPALQAGEKLVYCSLGTWSTRHLRRIHRIRFYRKLFAAIRQRPGWHFVVSIPEKDQHLSFLPYPVNTTVRSYVPQVEALSMADLFITHGGCSSIKEAACCGVPMIVFPGAVDQPGNAARVMYHGLGIRASFRRITIRGLLRAMDRVLGDPSFSGTADRFRQLCQAQSDCADGIRFLESFLQKDPVKKPVMELSAY